MFAIVPQVHLIVCLDGRVSPGVILHLLDLTRAQAWQKEMILLCDEKWRPYVNIDQPVVFVDKASLSDPEKMDQLLEQLDHFEIDEVTQIGDLNWGRWITAYFEREDTVLMNRVSFQGSKITSLQVVNDVALELGIDLTTSQNDKIKSSAVYIDPYIDGELSEEFLLMLNEKGSSPWPAWLNVISTSKDDKKLTGLVPEDALIDNSEIEMSLFNQSVLCFSDSSLWAQTSRSYKIALFKTKSEQSLFVPGDMILNSDDKIYFSELCNILSYWKTKRLKELAFQWLNMGIEINHIECFHSRLAKRNLLNYSSDLFHCQTLVKNFLEYGSSVNLRKINDLISLMRSEINNDPFSLSFSLKFLKMIVERMIASASCGERLFQRLGSDYHRIVIGEALIEGLIEKNARNLDELEIDKQLKDFQKFLMKVDIQNDQEDTVQQIKESQ